MFFLSKIEHTLRLPPDRLKLPLNEAIKEQLDFIFLDRVIDKLGLCVSVYDILSIDGGFVFPSDGASTYTVKFRLVMFRPYVGEVITARLKDSTVDGLQLSLGFFDDIYVPVPLLFSPNRSEPYPGHMDKVSWIWNYMDEDYPVDAEDEIRFKVHNVSYPTLPLEQNPPLPLEQSQDLKQKIIKPFAPMVVTGSLDMDGLGPTSWWG